MKVSLNSTLQNYKSNLCLLLASICLGSVGQVLMKAGANQVHIEKAIDLIQVIFSPQVLIGLLAYALSSIIWLVVLTRLPLSVAYPFGALSYVLVVLTSAMLGEQISISRLIGVSLIIGGIIIIGNKPSRK